MAGAQVRSECGTWIAQYLPSRLEFNTSINGVHACLNERAFSTIILCICIRIWRDHGPMWNVDNRPDCQQEYTQGCQCQPGLVLPYFQYPWRTSGRSCSSHVWFLIPSSSASQLSYPLHPTHPEPNHPSTATTAHRVILVRIVVNLHCTFTTQISDNNSKLYKMTCSYQNTNSVWLSILPHRYEVLSARPLWTWDWSGL